MVGDNEHDSGQLRIKFGETSYKLRSEEDQKNISGSELANILKEKITRYVNLKIEAGKNSPTNEAKEIGTRIIEQLALLTTQDTVTKADAVTAIYKAYNDRMSAGENPPLSQKEFENKILFPDERQPRRPNPIFRTVSEIGKTVLKDLGLIEKGVTRGLFDN